MKQTKKTHLDLQCISHFLTGALPRNPIVEWENELIIQSNNCRKNKDILTVTIYQPGRVFTVVWHPLLLNTIS